MTRPWQKHRPGCPTLQPARISQALRHRVVADCGFPKRKQCMDCQKLDGIGIHKWFYSNLSSVFCLRHEIHSNSISMFVHELLIVLLVPSPYLWSNISQHMSPGIGYHVLTKHRCVRWWISLSVLSFIIIGDCHSDDSEGTSAGLQPPGISLAWPLINWSV
jgi:hypothetical protein